MHNRLANGGKLLGHCSLPIFYIKNQYLIATEKINLIDIGIFEDLYLPIQWFAESMYEERVMEHYESASQETIKNAVNIYKGMSLITIEREDHIETVTVISTE